MKYTNNTIKVGVLFYICIVLLFCLFVGKLAYVSLFEVVEGTNIKKLAKNRVTATKVLKANRGNIYDANGNTLAQNINSYTLIAYLAESRTTDERYPKHVVDKITTATKLSEVLYPISNTMTKEYILSILSQTGKYQVEFGIGGKNITENVKRKIDALGLPGIDFIRSYKRYYQNGDFASYIIGYAKKKDDSDDLVGELGIEGFTDKYLKGKDGSIIYQKDAYGYQMADRPSIRTDAQDGYNIYLTIDKNVQMYLDNAVEEFTKYGPEWVTLTVADAKTGAVIGSSTSPSFNPNKLNITNYNNPLISYAYEPGSTMKIFSFMSAMESGKYNGEDTYKSGTIEVSDYKIKDWNNEGWGVIDYDTGFTYSSNVAAVRLAQSVGKKDLTNYYNKLGFGAKTGIELANEIAGDMSFDYATELASASYGQGVTVTPIQMIQALTTLTNDGVVLKPYVIDKIVDPNTNKTVYNGKRTEINKVYSTATVNKMIELMDRTVNGEDKRATGKVYETPAVRLIGKTGTANYVGSSGEYITGNKNVIRSFAGVFPKENPEYIIYVALKDFKGTTTNMGNIVKGVVESVAKYRNIDKRVSDKDDSKIIKVPKFINTTVLSSVDKLNSIGSNYVIIGNGDIVINQYPKSKVKTSQKTKIFLVTNGDEIRLPNMVGWSSNEVTTYANLVNMDYELNGYGYVTSTNINEGDIIDTNLILIANLEAKVPEKLVVEENNNEETEEEQEPQEG